MTHPSHFRQSWHRQEVILAESSPNAGDGCGLVSDGMYVVAVYVEDVNGTLALQWTDRFGMGDVFGEMFRDWFGRWRDLVRCFWDDKDRFLEGIQKHV